MSKTSWLTRLWQDIREAFGWRAKPKPATPASPDIDTPIEPLGSDATVPPSATPSEPVAVQPVGEPERVDLRPNVVFRNPKPLTPPNGANDECNWKPYSEKPTTSNHFTVKWPSFLVRDYGIKHNGNESCPNGRCIVLTDKGQCVLRYYQFDAAKDGLSTRVCFTAPKPWTRDDFHRGDIAVLLKDGKVLAATVGQHDGSKGDNGRANEDLPASVLFTHDEAAAVGLA